MKVFLLTVVTCSLLLTVGCSSFDVEGHTAGYDKTPETQKHGFETVHGSFYGFDWKERKRSDVVKCQGKDILYRVRYENNMLYSMAAVFSLGIYVPEQYEWWVLSPAAPDGQLL